MYCTSDEHYSARDECVENKCSNFSRAHVQVATSNFQTELLLRLLLTGTHVWKRVVATLLYSPVCTLHPQVTYAIVFSAGLNSLQVD